MNEKLCSLVDQIRGRFPHLEVQTDQCDTVRIISKVMLVGIEQKKPYFIAKFISLKADYDFETKVLTTLSSTDFGEFRVKLLQALVDLFPHPTAP